MKKLPIVFILILIKMHQMFAMDAMQVEQKNMMISIPFELKYQIFFHLIEKNKTSEEVCESLYPFKRM